MEDLKTSWQKQHISVISRLGHILKEGLHTDVKFLVGSTDPVIFEAHKLILASGSPVFERMFYNQLSEMRNLIILSNIEPLGFEMMLKYLYEDNSCFENEAEVFLTLLSADEFDIEPLKQICLHRLLELEPSPENVWTALSFCKYFKLEALEDSCVSFIIENARAAFESELFLTASMQVLRFVLSLPLLRITEFELLKFVAKWAENLGGEETVSLKELLRPLLSLIHFPSIGLEEFWKFVEEKQNLFHVNDRLAIIHNLVNPDSCPLPELCCKKNPRCHLTEKVSMNLMDTSRSYAYTSTVKWFECKYEIRMTSKEALYRDIQTMSIVWGNRLEDLPLLCDVIITFNQGLSFALSSIKKCDEIQEINFNFDKKVLGPASCHPFKIRVNFHRPVKIFFLHASQRKESSVECVLLSAQAMASEYEKIIFNKAQCVNDMTLIRKIQSNQVV